MQLEELEADATEDEIAAKRVAVKIAQVSAFERRRPAPKPFPEHLPFERLVIEAPSTCACCGSAQIVKGWHGTHQANAYGGCNDLYRSDRRPMPVISALCWSHARRKFFELTDIAGNLRKGKSAHEISPAALEAVARIDTLFDIERGINGMSAEDRHAARQQHARPPVGELHDWLMAQRAQMLSKYNPVTKAINYLFEKEGRWKAFTRFLDDGRLCLTNNAGERVLLGVALGRKAWLFVGSRRGGERAAFMYSLIVTAKMNDIDPQTRLADALGSKEGITSFTERGIESLQEFLADARSWEGGLRQFLLDSQCDPQIIERIMADEPKS